MSDIPTELMFTTTHEWLRAEGEGVYTIGITDHAQRMLGDAVVVNLPDVGAIINAGEECALVESVKAVSDIFSPVSGEIIAVNDEVRDMPELVNSDPYGDAWLFQIAISNDDELSELLDAEGYQLLIEDED